MILFLLFHFHGLTLRILASLVIGVAVNLVHYYGFFCASWTAQPVLVEPPPSSELLVDAELACVIVALMSAVMRFVFIGVLAAQS